MNRVTSISHLRVICLWLLISVACSPVYGRPDQPRVTLDTSYGTADGVTLRMDVYRPASAGDKRPGVLLIHGGGWSAGDKKFYAPLGQALAVKGYVVFSLNYRLLPKYRYPACLDDVQRAVRYVRAHAADYQLDPDRIGALGDSAGGYLAAMLGTRDTRDNSDTDLARYSSRVRCVVDFYAPTNFDIPRSSPDANPLAVQIVTAFLGKTPEQDPDLYKSSSVLPYVDKQSAPFLILHGTSDFLVAVSQSTQLHDALKAAGVDSTLLLAYKYNHGFLRPASPLSFGAAAIEFLNRYLKP